MPTFATAALLQAFMNRTFTAGETTQAELILDLVSAEIEAETGQTFESATATDLLAGTWSRDLELPKRPVTAVTTVKVNDVALGAGEFEFNDRNLIRRASTFTGNFDSLNEAEYGGDYTDEAQGARHENGSHWGGPASTITVTYTHGYATVPDDIRLMVLRAAARQLNNPVGVRQEALGAYSVTYPEVGAGSGGTVLNSTERSELRRRYSRRSHHLQPARG